MHLYRTTDGFIIKNNDEHRLVDEYAEWDEFINKDDLRKFIEKEWNKAKPLAYSAESADNLLTPAAQTS